MMARRVDQDERHVRHRSLSHLELLQIVPSILIVLGSSASASSSKSLAAELSWLALVAFFLVFLALEEFHMLGLLLLPFFVDDAVRFLLVPPIYL